MDRLEYKKDDAIKYIRPESKLIPILEKDGWKLAEKKKSKKKDDE